MRRIPLCVTLALLCAACGNVETGAASATPHETPDGYDPENPGDDPGGGGGGTPTLEGGIGGFFDIARQRSNVAEYDQFMLSGFFPSAPWPPEMGAFAALADHFPQMPFDACGPIPASTIGGGGPPEGALGWLDAGDLALAGPSGTDPVNELNVLGIVTYGAIPPSSHWQPAAQYSLSGSGNAGIGAFSAPLVSPHEVVITSPGDLLDPGAYPLPRNQDLVLTWEQKDDGSPLYVWIQQGTAEGDGTIVISRGCKFTDDGSAVIPASVLDDFDASPDGAVDDGLYIHRYRPHVFDVPGLAAPVLLGFESSYWVEARFE